MAPRMPCVFLEFHMHMRFHNNFARPGRGRQERLLTERQFQLLSDPSNEDRMAKVFAMYSRFDEPLIAEPEATDRKFEEA